MIKATNIQTHEVFCREIVSTRVINIKTGPTKDRHIAIMSLGCNIMRAFGQISPPQFSFVRRQGSK